MVSQLTTTLITVNYLTGYLKKTFLLKKMTEFSFSIGIKMIDCLNQKKKPIIYFLQLMKVLKTKRPTTVVFNVFHGSVWQAGRKMCLLSCLIGALLWQKGIHFLPRSPGSESPSNPQDNRIPRFSTEKHPYIQPIPAHVTPGALITSTEQEG